MEQSQYGDSLDLCCELVCVYAVKYVLHLPVKKCCLIYDIHVVVLIFKSVG